MKVLMNLAAALLLTLPMAALAEQFGVKVDLPAPAPLPVSAVAAIPSEGAGIAIAPESLGTLAAPRSTPETASASFLAAPQAALAQASKPESDARSVWASFFSGSRNEKAGDAPAVSFRSSGPSRPKLARFSARTKGIVAAVAAAPLLITGDAMLSSALEEAPRRFWSYAETGAFVGLLAAALMALVWLLRGSVETRLRRAYVRRFKYLMMGFTKAQFQPGEVKLFFESAGALATAEGYYPQGSTLPGLEHLGPIRLVVDDEAAARLARRKEKGYQEAVLDSMKRRRSPSSEDLLPPVP